MTSPFSRCIAALIAVLCFGGCTISVAPRSQIWVGIEPMADPAEQQDLLVNIAALYRVRVVDLSAPRNAWAFEALRPHEKWRLSARMLPGPACIEAQYGRWLEGVYAGGGSLAVLRTEAGDACLPVFAARLYERLYPPPPPPRPAVAPAEPPRSPAIQQAENARGVP